MATVSSSFVPGEWQEALQAIDQAVRQFGEYGVTQDELDREITSFRARYENAVKSASTRDSVALAGKLVYAVHDRPVFAAPATSLALFNAPVEGMPLDTVNPIAKNLFTGQGPIV